NMASLTRSRPVSGRRRWGAAPRSRFSTMGFSTRDILAGKVGCGGPFRQRLRPSVDIHSVHWPPDRWVGVGATTASAPPRIHGRNTLTRIRSRVGLAMLAAAALFIVPAANASAALIETSPCDGSTLTQAFARFGDSNFYKLVPGGDFEGS